jgi:hypothetical protein
MQMIKRLKLEINLIIFNNPVPISQKETPCAHQKDKLSFLFRFVAACWVFFNVLPSFVGLF